MEPLLQSGKLIINNTPMDEKITKLRAEADEAKFLYGTGQITREEAERRIKPWLEEANRRAEIISRKYGKRHKPFTFIGFLR